MASGGREVQSLDLLLSVRWSLLVNKVTLFAVKAHEQNGSMGWTRIACDPLTGLVPNLFNVQRLHTSIQPLLETPACKLCQQSECTRAHSCYLKVLEEGH